jgi:hypothetical protein
VCEDLEIGPGAVVKGCAVSQLKADAIPFAFAGWGFCLE